jgi:hypothetical protein
MDLAACGRGAHDDICRLWANGHVAAMGRNEALLNAIYVAFRFYRGVDCGGLCSLDVLQT